MPLFQSKSICETILMKMSLICMKEKLHVELIFSTECTIGMVWGLTALKHYGNKALRY